MRNIKHKNSSLFLMELIISILLFSVCSAICIQLFVKSHLLSRETEDLNKAINQASSVAEVLTSTDDTISTLTTIFPHAITDDNQITVYYDKSWTECSKMDASYVMDILQESTKNEIDVWKISLYKFNQSDASSIYQLSVKTIKGGSFYE